MKVVPKQGKEHGHSRSRTDDFILNLKAGCSFGFSNKLFSLFFFVSLSCAWTKRYFFHNFLMFLIIFDHVNACASMSLLVEIHNNCHLQMPLVKWFVEMWNLSIHFLTRSVSFLKCIEHWIIGNFLRINVALFSSNPFLTVKSVSLSFNSKYVLTNTILFKQWDCLAIQNISSYTTWRTTQPWWLGGRALVW